MSEQGTPITRLQYEGYINLIENLNLSIGPKRSDGESMNEFIDQISGKFLTTRELTTEALQEHGF